MRTGLYSVLDVTAGMLIGGVQMHRHEAAAIRAFTDVATMPQSIVASHPGDFVLVRLGWIIEHDPSEFSLEPDYAIVLAGATWAAARYQELGEPLGPERPEHQQLQHNGARR